MSWLCRKEKEKHNKIVHVQKSLFCTNLIYKSINTKLSQKVLNLNVNQIINIVSKIVRLKMSFIFYKY